jgi:diaminohydroxyphosphoribosylaminopyrimidine deaminase/5-amino-6-(5-phosphoribosylamino)uracil reductase
MTADDHRFMARALGLARRGLYTTHPNPRVGCVLVRDGQIVGEGFHERAGEAHAERIALIAAGDNARGATAYVTLEPCCHHGRTPPCSDGLIEAGVRRVVAAMQDPNPLVAGKGIEALRRAGIEVSSGLLQAQAENLNPGFLKRMRQGQPYVRVKLAMSLDGRTAMANGESKWITGEAARHDVQRLRARSEAVVTGIGTVLADDPSMNVRLDPATLLVPDGDAAVQQPLRVVLDPRLEMPVTSKMLGLEGATLVVCSGRYEDRANALRQAGAQVAVLAGDTGCIDLGGLLDHLAQLQINEVLIEAGQVLAGAVLAAGLADQLVIYAAPHIMGANARGLFHLPAVQQMHQRIDLSITDLRMVGDDIRVTATPRI